jgi:DNA-binding GntR family transcriptional regulator
MPVNAIVQVIRGGRLAEGDQLAREHRAIVEGFEAGDLAAARQAIRTHIASGERRALDVIARAGGEL